MTDVSILTTTRLFFAQEDDEREKREEEARERMKNNHKTKMEVRCGGLSFTHFAVVKLACVSMTFRNDAYG